MPPPLLIALQAVQVAIRWLRDWAPLPPLNDVAAVRAVDSTARGVGVTLVQSAPHAVGLAFSLVGLTKGPPQWLWDGLWISYGLLFAGELRAWWLPYLVRPEPLRAARYKVLFGAAHAFPPEHNGIRPNTPHVVLHAWLHRGHAGRVGSDHALTHAGFGRRLAPLARLREADTRSIARRMTGSPKRARPTSPAARST